MKKDLRVMISGGGTGGHIFPAIAIANAIKDKNPDTEFLFVGANNRMEMEKVPQAGFPIVGLPVKGFDRKNLLKNVEVLLTLCKALYLAFSTIRKFNPDVVIGVGGYVSGPTLRMANLLGIPTVIQEQNSYAGVTNKLLAKKANAICVAYPNMENYFPKDKIFVTGNPVRKDLLEKKFSRNEAYDFFELDPTKKTLLIIGGSLGAKTINESIEQALEKFSKTDIQVIWQTGKSYLASKDILPANIKRYTFISRMDYAYEIADLVVSRAGASSISELCILEKATILVPSPNVAEDHQTKNAQALSKKSAAILVKDIDSRNELAEKAINLIQNKGELEHLKKSIALLAHHDSADKIASIILNQLK